jgi:hypothetical protein
MADAIKITGGCYCDDITIMGEVSSDKIIACHCTDCQKFNGAPFRAVAVIAADGVKISGTVTEFLKIAESGNERVHGFCGKCGSHLSATDPAKTLFMIRTGCLDQNHELVPAKHIFGKSAVEWVSEVADSSWVSEGPASIDMTPFKKA